jgi:hypothetical protein
VELNLMPYAFDPERRDRHRRPRDPVLHIHGAQRAQSLVKPWAQRDSNPRPQPCESDPCLPL